VRESAEGRRKGRKSGLSVIRRTYVWRGGDIDVLIDRRSTSAINR
jgi:hypothetical protein